MDMDKKNIIKLLTLGILVLAVPLTTEVIEHQQILKSRAQTEPVGLTFIEETGKLEKRGNEFVLTENSQGVVKLKLTSPLGPQGRETGQFTFQESEPTWKVVNKFSSYFSQ